MATFKVGDIVTSIHEKSPSGYCYTVGDFQGEVIRITNDTQMEVKVLKMRSTPGSYGGSTIIGTSYPVYCREFKLLNPNPSKTHPQAFMEGVDVRIAPVSSYYDGMTEDYEGEVGNITSYDEYDVAAGCWLLTLEMSDGETLEVLENELVGYKGLASKASVSKSVVTPSVPVYAPPVKEYSTPDWARTDPGAGKKVPTSWESTRPAPTYGSYVAAVDPYKMDPIRLHTTPAPVVYMDFSSPTFRLDTSIYQKKVATLAF